MTEYILGPKQAVDPNDGKIVVFFDDDCQFDEHLQHMKYIHFPFSQALLFSFPVCNVFNLYKSGMLTDDSDCSCEIVDCIDHAILLVGYNDEDGIPYRKIKTLGGTGWEEGS